jgi:hypothetical protein
MRKLPNRKKKKMKGNEKLEQRKLIKSTKKERREVWVGESEMNWAGE